MAGSRSTPRDETGLGTDHLASLRESLRVEALVTGQMDLTTIQDRLKRMTLLQLVEADAGSREALELLKIAVEMYGAKRPEREGDASGLGEEELKALKQAAKDGEREGMNAASP